MDDDDDDATVDASAAAAAGDAGVDAPEGDSDMCVDTQVPPPPHRYGTRATNRTRRPGLDVGLNWREAKQEKVAAESERARKKATSQEKKNAKAQREAHMEDGIRKIAALKARRARDDQDNAEYVKDATASGYRAPSQAPNDIEPSGSEYDIGQEDGENSDVDGHNTQDSDGSAEAENVPKARKVSH